VNLESRFLKHAWSVTWGVILIATALRCFNLLTEENWVHTVWAFAGGFFTVRTVQAVKGSPT
jgi:hypothetical protein